MWPLAVAGLPQSRRAAERPRPLLVLPAMSWQGLNSVDDDLDGFADTLPQGRSVGLTRPFRSGGLPPRFALGGGAAAALPRPRGARLRPHHGRLARARRRGRRSATRPGVALAGSALWLPEPLMRRLRDEVEDGLRVASFGADALRRTVRLRGRPPDRPERPPPRRTPSARAPRLLRTSSAPLTVFEDGLGLFEDARRVLRRLHGVRGVDRAAERVARDRHRRPRPAPPGLRRLRAGRRPGDPQRHAAVGAELEEERLGAEVPAVTNRIWRLLGQGVR